MLECKNKWLHIFFSYICLSLCFYSTDLYFYFRYLNDISRAARPPIGSHVIKFLEIHELLYMCFSYQVGQNCITISRKEPSGEKYLIHKPSIATMDTPTDICSDDNGHIYVSGQGSNNIQTDERQKGYRYTTAFSAWNHTTSHHML